MSASSSKSSRSLSLQPGILDVDEELTKNSECQVIAVNIYVCSRPIEGKIGTTVPKFEHEYLLLDVKLKSGEHFWIRAEKYGSSGDSAGIHVKPAVNVHDEAESAIMRSSKCGEILMKDLIKTLTDHTPHYQLVSQNCMDYARDTFKKLLELF
ncbi:hypothetical protein CY35_02G025500 [Sphagnum magellanicum]|nr:hypothetical protein CY35_02G025400 [Sphagnum magellanicum]KAH9570146.1 hypothetical protein CY35_02G025500 [Sphagnum magellanicum]